MSREEANSREVKAKFSVAGAEWWSADLEVIEKTSTGTTETCKSSGHDRVCMWSRVYHTGVSRHAPDMLMKDMRLTLDSVVHCSRLEVEAYGLELQWLAERWRRIHHSIP